MLKLPPIQGFFFSCLCLMQPIQLHVDSTLPPPSLHIPTSRKFSNITIPNNFMSDPKVVGMYDNNCTLKNVQEQISKSTNLTKNEIYKKKKQKEAKFYSTTPYT